MSRFWLSLAAVMLFSVVSMGQVTNNGRFDINGISSKIELKPGENSCGKFSFGGWQKPENVKRYLTTDLHGKQGQWTTAKLTVIPQEDGRLVMYLLGPNSPGQALGVCYRNIKVNGNALWDGTVEGLKGWGFDKKNKRNRGITARFVADSDGIMSIQVWHNAPARKGFAVKKDVPVEVTFDFKPVGKILPPDNEYFPLDISKAANMGFIDDVAGDGKGGWTDQGSTNDLRAFDPKSGVYADYVFQVIDPKKNNGKSCVILKSANSTYGSAGITLPVNQECNRIALLTGAGWAGKNNQAADVIVKFSDGSQEVYPLTTGQNIGEWWNPPKRLPAAELAWTGVNNKNMIGLYRGLISFKEAKMVRSITIKPIENNEVVLGIVGVTAAMIRSAGNSEVDGLKYTVNLKQKSKLIALPVDTVKMAMRKKGLPADTFFDEYTNLKRVTVSDDQGKTLPFTIAKFHRKLAPVILVRSDAGTDKVVLSLGKENPKNLMKPQIALENIAGSKVIDWNDYPWTNGIMLEPSKAEIIKGKVVRDFDSFYQQAIDFGQPKSAISYTFELKKPETVKLFAYVRHLDLKSQSNRLRVEIDGGKFIVVGGVFYKSYAYYWTGGQRVKLDAGKHTMKIYINHRTPQKLEMAKFYLGFDYHAPEPPGFTDEIGALKSTGFAVYGYPEKTVALKNTASKDWLCRIVNADHSYPDLSSLVKNDIDKDGNLRPDGKEFRFSNGKALPFIWGKNIGRNEFYRMIMPDRLGGPDGADRLMARYKALGISSLRVFFVTMIRADWTLVNNIPMFLVDEKELKYAPEYLGIYQRLIAAAHRHGIYLNITFGHFPWSLRAYTDLYQAMFYDRRMIDRQKERIKLLMNTPNPYRNGIRPADDPTISILGIENECNFLGAGFGRHNSWIKEIKEEDKAILYPLWHQFLKNKYQTMAALKKQWGKVQLIAGKTEESFDNVEFVPVWDAKEWGQDDSNFTVKMDDLRVSSASFGKNKRSNPSVADGFEFMYDVYSSYLKEMSKYLRDIGFKGVITACGPDTENYYFQRAACNNELDATSGGTGYWNRTGYGFLRSLNWMDQLIYASSSNKPIISREYGANLSFENSWWGNVVNAAVQKAMGKAYLYDFAASIPGCDVTPDYLWPEDAHEQRAIDLLHEMNFYSTMSNTAAAIVVQSDELKKSDFKLDIAYPLDNVFYSAPFRGYNKMTIRNYVPFLYTDSNVCTFTDKYNGDADLVVNEPSLPAGDYSKAKNTFMIKPHSSLNRSGQIDKQWFAGKAFKAEGFLDKQNEQDALYDAIIAAGGKMPVSKSEFGKVWRDWNRKLEIDTTKGIFRGDTSTWGSFIGELKYGKEKAPRQYVPEGAGDVWSFFGSIPEYDLFMAIMNGKVTLKEVSRLKYMMLGTSSINVTAKGKKLVAVTAGAPVNIALKTDDASLLNAKTIYVTFYRSKSCQLPAEITFGRKIASVEACNRDGAVIADVPHTDNSFENLWTVGHMISFYRVNF